MIPYGRQNISDEDISEVIRVLRSHYITQGPEIEKFESGLKKFTNAKYVSVTNSCTSALHLACLALGVKSGDNVWTSAISFVASANSALYCGANIDFLDIELETGLIDVNKLESKLKDSKKKGNLPKVVIPVHFSGQPCDMEEIYKLSKKYNFFVIEDAAHAIGATYNDSMIGACKYSDITVFSFHPVKIITTGEGGATLTNSKEIDNKIKLLRSHGINKNLDDIPEINKQPWYYEQQELGFHYRITDIQAALGLSQLKRIKTFLSKRKEIVNYYDAYFNNNSFYESLVKRDNRTSSNHLYVIKIKNNLRDKLFNYLRNHGIGVNVHYIPIYMHKFYKGKCQLVNSENFYKTSISLPIYFDLDSQELKHIINTLEEFRKKN